MQLTKCTAERKEFRLLGLKCPHLHFLILINQEKTGDLLQQFCSLRFDFICYFYSRWDRCPGRVARCRFGWRRVRRELVFLLVASTVCAFLTVLA